MKKDIYKKALEEFNIINKENTLDIEKLYLDIREMYYKKAKSGLLNIKYEKIKIDKKKGKIQVSLKTLESNIF